MTRPIWLLAALVLCTPALATPLGQLKLPRLSHLSAKAVDHTDISIPGFVFRMMATADDGDEAARQTLAHLRKIEIHSYTFDSDQAYSAGDVEALRQQLQGKEWSPVVHTHDAKDGEHADIYLCFEEKDACGLAILVTAPRELTVVNLVGRVPLEQVEAIGRELHVNTGSRGH